MIYPQDFIQKKKEGQPITMLTAYDALFASAIAAAGINAILVGDSLANTAAGFSNTLPVTMDTMIYHTQCVRRGAPDAFIIGDMPFMSYQSSLADAMHNAGRFLKEGGAQSVKLEVGESGLDTVKAMVDCGIPVMGHIGFTPQSVYQLGGYKVQGKTEEAADKLLHLSQKLEKAGCFAVVLEMIPSALAQRISKQLHIPTIGIGAGPHCDGQVLVLSDVLGLSPKKQPRFSKPYASVYDTSVEALKHFKSDIEGRVFPDISHSI
jgi:3-methyl-2-oxobutanoate hydroxymethyltransferase